jgi:hypothetical protein
MSKLKAIVIIGQKPERLHMVLTEEKLDEIGAMLERYVELSMNCA